MYKRQEHTNCKTAVIGISGGLDSTLALLVTVRAFDLLGKDHKDIAAEMCIRDRYSNRSDDYFFNM